MGKFGKITFNSKLQSSNNQVNLHSRGKERVGIDILSREMVSRLYGGKD